MKNVALLSIPCLLFLVVVGCGPPESSTPPADTAIEKQSGVLNVDGVTFHYVREGQGAPAVVVGSSVYYPRAFSQDLRQHFDFVFADGRHFIPSYQPSEKELEELSLDTWADDLEALRVELGIEEWAVFGHSVQAQIALAYASRYPERTSHLVLIGGVPYAGEDVRNEADRLWNEQASEARRQQHSSNREGLDTLLVQTPRNRRFAVSYNADAARFWADSTYDATPLFENLETSPAFSRLFQTVPGRDEVRQRLAGLDMPILVVLGKQDYAVPYTIWQPLVEGLPNVRYELLEHDSHNPMTEAPERFDPVLLNWFDR